MENSLKYEEPIKIKDIYIKKS